MQRQRGFTLLEVLVTVAIFAMMYVLAVQFVDGALRTRDILNQGAGQMEQVQRAVTYLTLDFEQMIARPVRDPYGDPQPALIGKDNFVAFTRLGWANPFHLRQRSDMQRVIYTLEDHILYRRYWPVLDTNVATQYQEDILLKNVDSFQVRYLAKDVTGQLRWQELWPTAALAAIPVWQQPLPKSVEVTIKLEDGDEIHRYFRTVINPWAS